MRIDNNKKRTNQMMIQVVDDEFDIVNIIKLYLQGIAFTAPNWTGACNELAKLAKPTLVIAGTDDNLYVPHANALVIAGKIPGAWLVQIKNAGHAVMNQYPEEIGKILSTFLSTTTSSS